MSAALHLALEEIDDLKEQLAEYKQRAEAAEEKLRELERQEPVAYWFRHNDPNGSVLRTERMLPNDPSGYEPLYAKPFPALKQEEK